MATRSNIGLKNDDGTIDFIYCHYDGYPEYVGKMLKNHYTNYEKVKHLISLGDISVLCKYVCPPHYEVHTFDSRLDDVTVAYHRDRGETMRPAYNYSGGIDAYVKRAREACIEYVYVGEVKDGEVKWRYWHCNNAEGVAL